MAGGRERAMKMSLPCTVYYIVTGWATDKFASKQNPKAIIRYISLSQIRLVR
jgi:hypothetical protein